MADYFERFEATAATQRTYLTLLEAYAKAKANPRLQLRAVAIGRLIIEYRDLHSAMARNVARAADDLIRGYIDDSRAVGYGIKRPKRSIRSGGLSGNIRSEPLPTPVPYGSVGIGRLDILDKTVNPGYRGSGEYWRAQEYGTSAHVGRIVPGFFQPGGAAPAAGRFREHAYFQQTPYTPKSKIPAMVIKKPILARHFMRNGTEAAYAAWRAEQRAIERTLVSEMTRIRSL